MKAITAIALGALLVSSPGWCQLNGQASLAMHLVASDEYLVCSDLCPSEMSCLDIDCDLTAEELLVSGGYGYAVFLAYNVEEVLLVEFLVVGWPLGSGSPDFTGPFYCPVGEAVVAGEPFEKRGGSGGKVLFGCQTPCSAMYCFSYLAFGPSIWDSLPITLAYAPSTFTYSFGMNFFDPCVEMIDVPFQHEHYAVIGGECDPIPNCEPGPTASQEASWGEVKSLYR